MYWKVRDAKGVIEAPRLLFEHGEPEVRSRPALGGTRLRNCAILLIPGEHIRQVLAKVGSKVSEIHCVGLSGIIEYSIGCLMRGRLETWRSERGCYVASAWIEAEVGKVKVKVR